MQKIKVIIVIIVVIVDMCLLMNVSASFKPVITKADYDGV
jgi:hypothetical protein